MKRLGVWDAASAVFIAAIAVPYIGYLVRGTMPFIQDPRGMSGTGLVLGIAAFVAAVAAARPQRLSKWQYGVGAATLLLGIAALTAAETFAAEVLLAIFMGAVLVTWLGIAVERLDMVGTLHHGPPIAH